MRGVWLGVLFVSLSSMAMAQSTPLEPVSLTPPQSEPGWTVRAFKGGYARWEAEPSDGEPGGVQVVPAPVVEAPRLSEAKEEGPKRVTAGGVPPLAPRPMPCEQQRRLLAVRLLELRGIYAPPESAPYVLAAIEAPLWPQAWAGVQGLGPGAGSSLLATAYSSDLLARDLVDELARCLDESGVPVRPAY